MGQTGGGYVADATGVVAWLRPEHRIHAARGPASPNVPLSKGGTSLQGGPTFAASAEAGFADQPHLNRWFTRYLGITPAAYRRALVTR